MEVTMRMKYEWAWGARKEVVPPPPGKVMFEHKVTRAYFREADFVPCGFSQNDDDVGSCGRG